MSEPGQVEQQPITFEQAYRNQISSNASKFGAEVVDIMLLDKKQSLDLKNAMKGNDSRKIVEASSFKFVATVGSTLQSFALVALSEATGNDPKDETKAITMENALWVVASDPMLNRWGTIDGKQRPMLEKDAYDAVLKVIPVQKLDEQLKRKLHPQGLADKVRNFLRQ